MELANRFPVVIYVSAVHDSGKRETRARIARGGCPYKFIDRVHLPALVIRPHAAAASGKHYGGTKGHNVNTTEEEGNIHGAKIREVTRPRTYLENPDGWEINQISFFLSEQVAQVKRPRTSNDLTTGLPCSVHCLPVCSIYKTLTGKRGWRADLGVLPVRPCTTSSWRHAPCYGELKLQANEIWVQIAWKR